MEVNISNIKQQHNQVSTPSQQAQSRASSIPKQPLPKPATFTQPTESKVHERQPLSQSHNSSANHRKTKSNVPEVQKPSSSQAREALNRALQNPNQDKFAQTQKINTNLSKSSEQ
mgnify:CR=1 FL=1